MWSYGYTDPFSDDVEGHVVLGEESTFSEAIRQLREHVMYEVKDAVESEIDAYEALVAEISDIADDPGIMDDPDQWEDQEFYLTLGAFSVNYWIVTD